MKPSRASIVFLLFAFLLAASLPALQTAFGRGQMGAWMERVYLPLVIQDEISIPPVSPTTAASSTPTPSFTPTGTPTPTGTLTPTDTSTATASRTPTNTLTATATPTPTATRTPSFTPTHSSLPTLSLTVTQSPLDIYPPVMIYTAQVSYVPPVSSAQLKVDFYHLVDAALEYLGTAAVDEKGQAVLSKPMYPGTYTAIARVVIDAQVIWSNSVMYTIPGTPLPTLKLEVTQSMLAVYPPVMIYTAQLSPMPAVSPSQLTVDFYNFTGTKVEYLGSAPVDQDGQAVLSRQIYPGTYTAVARVSIGGQTIWSNSVTYRVW